MEKLLVCGIEAGKILGVDNSRLKSLLEKKGCRSYSSAGGTCTASTRCVNGGPVSGGLEILDFDDGSLFPPWRDMVATIVERLPVVETPSGGWHVLFRCNEFCGNTKIAMDPRRKKPTLIETRGDGGYRQQVAA